MNPRTRGLGRILKPNNSRFWHCAYYHMGKEHRESTRIEYVERDPDSCKREMNFCCCKACKSEREADQYRSRKITEVKAEQLPNGPEFETPADRKITINQLLDGLKADYQERRIWSKNTEYIVGSDAETEKPRSLSLRGYFGALPAVNLKKVMVTKYRVKLQENGYADASINRHVQILLQAFTIADRVPPNGVKRLSEVGNERQGFFDRAEWLRFHACLPDYLKDFCHFLYLLGWRKGSAAKLLWKDIDKDRVLSRAINNKNRKPVTCPAQVPGIAEIIERRKAQKVEGCPYVFHYTKKGKTRPIGDIRKAWAAALTLAGLEKKIPHDLCRTAIRNLIAAGVDEVTAMRICGRRTLTIFVRYSIRNEENSERALVALDAHLREQDTSLPMLTNALQ